MSSTTRTAATAAASPDTAGGRTSRLTIGGRDLRSILLEGRAFIALIVLIIVFSMLSDVFLSSTNLITMTKHVAYNAILALGMLFVVLKGGIDLSVGSVVGLSGMVAGFLLGGWQLDAFGVVMYPPVWVVVLAGVLVGMFVGLVNGVLVAKLGVAPFIATLGTLYMARGAALLISDGATFPRLGGDPALGNTGFLWLGGGRILGIPNSIWVMVGVATVAVFILRKTPFGRWIYSIGGNERAAELAGVPVARVKILAYVISGACAAIVGMIIASELTSAAPQTGETFELNAIAAVVIGGAALSGGRGNVQGVLIGAFVIGFLSDGLVLVGVSTFWQIVIKGAVIVLAVILDQAQQRIQRTEHAAIAAADKSAPGSVKADEGDEVGDPGGRRNP